MERERRMSSHRSAPGENDRSDRWRDRIGRRLVDEFRNAVKHCLKSHWARPDESRRAAFDPACRCSSGWHCAETSVEWSTTGLEEWSSPPNHSFLCVVEFHFHVDWTRPKRSIERRACSTATEKCQTGPMVPKLTKRRWTRTRSMSREERQTYQE